MSRVDERIRREIERLTVRVDDRDAFERVAVRRRRLRTAHRVRRAMLALAVVAGSVGAGVGLIRLVDANDRTRPGSGDDPTPSSIDEPPVVSVFCAQRELSVDLDGDGAADDLIETWGQTSDLDASCEESPPLERFVVSLVIDAEANAGPSYTQRLPECTDPYACRVIATPDLDGDGRPEIAIQLGFGVSTIYFAPYRFEPLAPDGPLVRLDVAEPGDPFDENFGIGPGPATFTWYGSVTHQHWISCDVERDHLLGVVTALRDERDPSVQNVHVTLFRLQGTMLVLEDTTDERVADGSLDYPEDFCGSPLLPA